MEELLQPQYLTAAFSVVMMLLSFHQGYRLGRKRAINEIYKIFKVPPGARITGVMYGPANRK